MSPPRMPQPQFNFLPFRGGLDTETPSWQVKPGFLRDSQNYEVGINGGYRDIEGDERFDGRPKPSDGVYSIIEVNITGSFSVGDTITQLVSGATGFVLAIDLTTRTNDYLVITKITGTFNDSDDLQVSASTEGTALTGAIASSADTPKLNATYNNLTADEYRTDIAVIAGSGPVRGVWMASGVSDVVYAFRDNAGATACDVWKSSASGWTAVALGRELSFTSGGTYVIAEGDTITGATSTETAVVTRVVLESGSFAGGDAAGRLIFASQSGAFQAENLDVGANLNVATIAADSTAITLSAGGRFEFVTANFGGDTGTRRIYGCDGVNRGFEFDGTVFAPIDTGMTTDTPNHVIYHKNHLFFSFDGSAQHSGIGTPYIWSPVFGAAELATGDTITGFISEPGGEGNAALGIYNRNTIHTLYGASSADWNLVRYRDEIGAYAYSLQQFGQTMFLDDRGISNLHTTQAFGNFQHNTLSTHIQRRVNAKKTLVNASCIARDKNQYRLFFTDKSALYMTFDNKKITGIMPVAMTRNVECIFSLEAVDGSEVIIYGADNGFVYEMDKGTSFDGDSIDGWLILHWHYLKSLRQNKSFKSLTLEAEGDGYAEFDFTYELGYASTKIAQPSTTVNILDFSSVFWDAFTWDAFTWDGVTLAPSCHTLNGSAENISVIIRRTSDYFEPVTFSGALIRYIMRRQLR